MVHTIVKWSLHKLSMLKNHILSLPDCLKPPPQMEMEVEQKPPPQIQIDDEVVVGFIDEEQILIERITKGTAQLDTVSIVGMGGLGKTTLAKKLYNSPFVRFHFHVRAFCNVGQEYSSKNILLEILNGLIVIDDEIRAMTKDDLAHRLYKCLKGHRYLIIMDNIWDVTAWKEINASFPNDNNGSRVVFTTRIINVALQSKKSDCSPHYLRFFTDEESWELLQAKVFHKDPCPLDLREVGMLIARKCNGLPLAVVVIAGLLTRIPTSQSSWNGIADDLNSYVSSSKGCMGTLELSYKHLPVALKSCLLYINGAIEKDNTIRAKRLMLMWAAKGILPGRNSSSSLAKQYLNDLVDRSLVIVQSRSSTGGIKRCSVHDLIRDLCHTKSQFFRLMMLQGHVYKQYFPISDCTVNCDEPFPNVLQPFQLLDVQVMAKVLQPFQGIDFPEKVTTLVSLRYLAIEYNELTFNFGPKVPSTIAMLLKLETFILKTKGDVFLPDTIWKMKRLRHVDVGKNAFVQLDTDVGKDSSKLPNVESFSCVTISHGKDGEELLRRLSNVRKLSCRYGSHLNQERKLLKLDHHLTMLESLNIVSKSQLEGYGVSVFSFPATLKKLSLSSFRLPWSEFPTIIGKLPCLEILKLVSDSFEGETWDMEEEEYPSLKYLELNELDVVDWIASVDSFPCLERLIVSYCYKLVEIPACFGDVPTMKTIEVHISNKGAEDSAIQIMKEQLEMGNESLEVQVTKYM